MEFYDALICILFSVIENVKVARYVICCNIIDHADKEYYIFFIFPLKL